MRLNTPNLTTFTSIPLYDVKLKQHQKDGSHKKLDAKFSKLDRKDKNDVLRAKDICEKWQNSEYGVDIARDFISNDKNCDYKDFDFYVIEGEDEKIYSIAEFDREDRKVELLQSNPSNKEKKIHGAGEVMLWGIAKHNEPNEQSYSFYLRPVWTAVDFYKKIGLDTSSVFFVLYEQNREKFLNRITKKYDIKS